MTLPSTSPSSLRRKLNLPSHVNFSHYFLFNPWKGITGVTGSMSVFQKKCEKSTVLLEPANKGPWKTGLLPQILVEMQILGLEVMQVPSLIQVKQQRKDFWSCQAPALGLLCRGVGACVGGKVPSAPSSRGDAHGSSGCSTVEAEVLMRSWGRLSRASCIRRRARWKASATQRWHRPECVRQPQGRGGMCVFSEHHLS